MIAYCFQPIYRTLDALFDLYWLGGWNWDQLHEYARELLPC